MCDLASLFRYNYSTEHPDCYQSEIWYYQFMVTLGKTFVLLFNRTESVCEERLNVTSHNAPRLVYDLSTSAICHISNNISMVLYLLNNTINLKVDTKSPAYIH